MSGRGKAPECLLIPNCGNSVTMTISSTYVEGVLSAVEFSEAVLLKCHHNTVHPGHEGMKEKIDTTQA